MAIVRSPMMGKQQGNRKNVWIETSIFCISNQRQEFIASDQVQPVSRNRLNIFSANQGPLAVWAGGTRAEHGSL